MSRQELLDDLRRQGEAKVKALWEEVRTAADAYRQELAQEQQAEAERLERETSRQAATSRQRLLNDSRRELTGRRLQATQALAERLHRLALAELPALRRDGGGDLFAALAAELPELPWAEIRVHPDDAQAAQRHFAKAQILPDPELVGGLVARAQDRPLTVDNSLDRRLERLWPQLLPLLLAELKPEETP